MYISNNPEKKRTNVADSTMLENNYYIAIRVEYKISVHDGTLVKLNVNINIFIGRIIEQKDEYEK